MSKYYFLGMRISSLKAFKSVKFYCSIIVFQINSDGDSVIGDRESDIGSYCSSDDMKEVRYLELSLGIGKLLLFHRKLAALQFHAHIRCRV